MNKYLSKLKSYISSNRIPQVLVYPAYKRVIVPFALKKKRDLMFKHGKNIIERLDDAMNQAGVFYWLECGTLLGAVREKGFLPGDLDIDVGIFVEEYNENLHSQLIACGFKRKYEYVYKQNKLIVALQFTYEYKGVGVDLFCFHKLGNNMCYHFFLPEEGRNIDYTVKQYGGLFIAVECVPNTGFSKLNFLGRYYNVPLDYDKHLSVMYGDDYLIPNPKWEFRLSDYKVLYGKFAKFTRFS